MNKNDSPLKEDVLQHHLTGYSKHENFDVYLRELLYKVHGERFLQYRDMWDKAERQEFLPEFPLMIGIETIDRCNYSCIHCYRAAYPGSSARLEKDTFFRVMDEGREHNLPSMAFGGGSEPLLHPDALDMAEYAVKNGVIDFILGTNGAPLTESKADRLLDIGITRLCISLDAATSETYRKIRGGDLERIESVIRYIVRRKNTLGLKLPILRVSFVAQPENYHEREAFINKWKDLADRIDIQRLIDFSHVHNLQDVAVNSFYCSQPWKEVNIWAKGGISPCCTFYGLHHQFGDVSRDTIAEVWHSDKADKLRHLLRNGPYPNACANCYGHLGEW